MRRTFMLRLALGRVGIFSSGALLGQALANYAESGSFRFYREANAYAWQDRPAAARPIDVASQFSSASPEAGLLQAAALER